MVIHTITLRWGELTHAWNASADKRFEEWLAIKDKGPRILHEDGSDVPTRYEYFEKEYNVNMQMTKNDLGFDKYTLIFKTPEEVTFFVLRWL
jgi:hypothetical protein